MNNSKHPNDSKKIKKNIEDISILINKGKLSEAENKAEKIINIFPNDTSLLNILGIILNSSKKYQEALKIFHKITKIKPNHPEGHFNLGKANDNLGKFDAAIASYSEAIKHKFEYPKAHNNLGNTLSKIGKLKEAIISFEHAISIKPDYYYAYNNLGNTLKDLGRFQEAISNYEIAIKINPNLYALYNNLANALKSFGKLHDAIKNYKIAIELNPNHSEINNNLGKALIEDGQFKRAINYLKKSRNITSKAQILECLYELGEHKEFDKTIKNFSLSYPNNIRIASISTFAANQRNIENLYPFCKNPFHYIKFNNLLSSLDDPNRFIDLLISETDKFQVVYNLSNTSTTNGFQTVSNLFNFNIPVLTILENLIKKQIHDYKISYSDSESGLINKWPNNYHIKSWCVRLLKSGYQDSHIHPEGWLSGVFYLKVPKKLSENNQGAIEFSLHGYNYNFMKKNTEQIIYKPKVGDLIIFPSSLFHKTIPFESKDERISIAFDMVP